VCGSNLPHVDEATAPGDGTDGMISIRTLAPSTGMGAFRVLGSVAPLTLVCYTKIQSYDAWSGWDFFHPV